MYSPQLQPPTAKPLGPLTFRTKLTYGIGELGSAIPSSIGAFFLLFFLTNEAGLNAGLAGSVLLLGRVWDAGTDLMVGWLSDRTQSPLGRRYPWMLCGVFPLALAFFSQWYVPPTQNQGLLFAYYSAVSLLAFSAFTAVQLPFAALSAELAQVYDERTSLISYKSAFSIGGSIFGLVLANFIFDLVDDPNRQYLVMSAICGVLMIAVVWCSVWGTYPRYRAVQAQRSWAKPISAQSLLKQFYSATKNRPFRYVIGLYICSWTSVQVSAVILPYFVVDWMMLTKQHFIQMALTVQGTAVLMMFPWNWVGQKTSKKAIYFMGAPLAISGLIGLPFIQPGQVVLMYGLAIIIGTGVATVYLVPWSMLPDVVDLDELTTGQRREGIFYSFVVFIQKMGMALALFLTGKLLDWAGFVSTVAGEGSASQQPDSAFWAIRLISGPLPAIALIGGLFFACFYPISREVHAEILLKLEAQRQNH